MVIIKKKKDDIPEKDLFVALETFEKIENKFDDLVELTCNIRLLLRRAINKVKSGSSIDSLEIIDEEMKKVSEKVKDLSDLTMFDASDLELKKFKKQMLTYHIFIFNKNACPNIVIIHYNVVTFCFKSQFLTNRPK